MVEWLTSPFKGLSSITHGSWGHGQEGHFPGYVPRCIKSLWCRGLLTCLSPALAAGVSGLQVHPGRRCHFVLMGTKWLGGRGSRRAATIQFQDQMIHIYLTEGLYKSSWSDLICSVYLGSWGSSDGEGPVPLLALIMVPSPWDKLHDGVVTPWLQCCLVLFRVVSLF